MFRKNRNQCSAASGIRVQLKRNLHPDNLKSGVITHPKDDDVVLNHDYEELGNYYGTAIVPAMPRTPKGKPSVEGTVGKQQPG